MARVTGLEPATSGVTGRHSNRLSYTRTFISRDKSLPKSEPSAPCGLDRSVGGFLRGSRSGVKQVSRQKNDGMTLSTPLPLFDGVFAKNFKKTSRRLLRFFRDPHRSRPPTRRTT